MRPKSFDVERLPVRHQRVDGAARIAWGRTGLADLYQRAPARLHFPRVPAGEPAQGVAITTSGGLTGGDRILNELRVLDGAAFTLTTQAAERFYRALPGDAPANVLTRVTVGHDSWAEWLAQEAILFDGSRVRRRFEADVAPDGRLLAVESLVFGRRAMGETVRTGSIHDSWRIRRDGRLVWVDALALDGDIAAAMARPFAFGDAVSSATILYVGADAAAHLGTARDLIGDEARAGATSFDGLLIVRLVSADASALRRAVARLVAGLRHATGGHAAELPRVWAC